MLKVSLASETPFGLLANAPMGKLYVLEENAHEPLIL